MKSLNKTASKTFAKLIAGLTPDKPHRKIENGSWMPLSVEIIDNLPNGTKIVMLCHYGEQNGDLMADPEMNFLVNQNVIGTFVCPIYYHNDYVGKEMRSVISDNREYNTYRINYALQADQTSFANTWLKNIKDQGFLEKLQPSLAIG